jgi:hypothetical protein
MRDEYPFPPVVDFDPPSGDHYRELAAKLRELAGQCLFVNSRGPLMRMAVGERRANSVPDRCQPGASEWRLFASRSVTSGTGPTLRSAANLAEMLVGATGIEPVTPPV